jgi:hypothetical protein
MEIKSDQMVFLLGHKGGIAPEVDSIILELIIALTPEDAVAGKTESFVLLIRPDHTGKLISSIQMAVQRLRQTN